MQIRIAETADIAGMHRVRLAVRENALSSPDRVRPADYEPLIGAEGRGIGRQLHDVMMDWFFASGAEPAWLPTARLR